jgi:type III pantothenate kinase
MILAIDVGNSRVKLGAFGDTPNAETLPDDTLALARDSSQWSPLDPWLSAVCKEPAKIFAWMCSVHRTTSGELLEHLRRQRHIDPVRALTWQDFPLRVSVSHPEHVGIDRLAAAYAAHCLADAKRAAIVVDFGSAITVDRVSASGEFEGGAILPGLNMAAAALHRSTDALPHIELNYDDATPNVLGKSTKAAITSGIYWGAVGAARELVSRLVEHGEPAPAVFSTGGAAQWLARSLAGAARFEPDLVLRGIALAARRLAE